MGKKRIVFMGTADFAARQLEALLQCGQFELPFVVSQPDKKVGRKQEVRPTPVKKTAEEYGVPVFQPRKLKDGVLAAKIRDAEIDLLMVVAYGRLLPPDILAAAKEGALNLHASLLPKLRGACPIQMAIVSGERESGLSLMRVCEGLDEGEVYWRHNLEIGAEERAAELFERLAELGAAYLPSILTAFFEGRLCAEAQDPKEASLVRPLRKEEAEINWDRSSRQIDALVRGLYDWPIAYSFLDGKRWLFLRGRAAAEEILSVAGTDFADLAAGTLFSWGKRLFVRTGDGLYEILRCKTEGKKEQDASDLAHNFREPRRFSYDPRQQGPQLFLLGQTEAGRGQDI